jgi:hypothetical protein
MAKAYLKYKHFQKVGDVSKAYSKKINIVSAPKKSNNNSQVCTELLVINYLYAVFTSFRVKPRTEVFSFCTSRTSIIFWFCILTKFRHHCNARKI